MTPVKYEQDIQKVNNIFLFVKNYEKTTNRKISSEISHPHLCSI